MYDPPGDPAPPGRHPRRRGEETRERIIAILHAEHERSAAWPTLDELVTVTGLGKSTLRHHVAWLRDAGVVRYEVRREVVLVAESRSAVTP